ncbi:hypothetical protein [Paraburkholderia sp. BCC1885]|uniref:hypothetical protein n=1 Tax=Paraburkholderia sp. BCC1885 TaxID=2562669 RepID=UPI0011836101|nr:hypothetical protein [Paraburkholderia sp. BCC1885]
MHSRSSLTHTGHDTGSDYVIYPGTEWFAEAFDTSIVTAWVKASRVPHWLRPASIDIGSPLTACDECPHLHEDCVDGNVCVDHFEREMALYRTARDTRQEVCEVHWSTGLASLPDVALQRIRRAIGEHFELTPEASLTVRIDSSGREKEPLPLLHELGATSVHIGTARARDVDHDFTREQVLAARAAGFRSIAVDLPIDGARKPRQMSLAPIDAVISCRPTRVMLTRECDSAMPGTNFPETVLRSISDNRHQIAATLIDAGYQCIASDVFALRTDTHAIAHGRGCLTRQPYGYSAQPVSTLIALGPGTVGYVGALYYQNQRLPQSYSSMLRAGQLPVERGLFLTPDDLIRRTIIMSISTNLFVDIAAIEAAYGIDFRSTFASEWKQLEKLERAGLLTVGTQEISLTPAGRLAGGLVCRVFDLRTRLLADKIPNDDLL